MCWHPLARKLKRRNPMSDTEKLNEAADSGLLQPRLVRLCEGGRSGCSRPGDLVIQDVMEPLEFERGKPARPWVFRHYLCQHHRGAWNRTRLDHCKKLTVVEYVDDEILLPNS
jgi:hypothetical protein